MNAKPPPTNEFDSVPDSGAWRLTLIADGDGKLIPPIEGTKASLDLTPGRLAGNASCNRFFADGGLAAISGPIGMTMMLCPDATMRQEQRFIELLQETTTAAVIEGRLHCADTSGADVLVFEPADESR